MTAAYTTQLVTDGRAFAEVAADWGRLYERCAAATPFQTHAWLHSWWLSYGRPGRLRLVLVREGAELVAAAPLMLRRGPVPTLVPLGGAISDYGDVLIDDERADRAAIALAEALSAAARTALIDFREVRPGGAVEYVYDRWSGPRRRMPDSLCLELPAVPMNELLSRLPSSKAQRVRAKLRKLGSLGVERHVVAPDQVGAALQRLLELHRLQWQGRNVTQEHLQTRFCEHLVRSVGPMVSSGDAVVTEFRLDGDVVAVDLTLLSRRLAGGYLYGAHPRLRERKADVAVMLLDACTQHTGDGGLGTLSLLRGNEPYKHHWRPEPVVNQRLLLARRRTAPLMSAVVADVAARRGAKEMLRRFRERTAGGGTDSDPAAPGGRGRYRIHGRPSGGRHSPSSTQSPMRGGEQPVEGDAAGTPVGAGGSDSTGGAGGSDSTGGGVGSSTRPKRADR
ncbi:Glycosyl transferase family 1 OS=Streptomyces aurantiogriseus OX=66870 GN=GCM10010251_70780 PE=4 SV=1 [Streptomyces aurantiogriseus]|uniref:Glycosyl transferase family 1 n=1 Tax=Streptomyces aurantiogriseus TaxID=66870 RepID=A0A918FL08_9ACTN|nr:glycosyl transferase family 1 [Streptomyces aurantiogriseus]